MMADDVIIIDGYEDSSKPLDNFQTLGGVMMQIKDYLWSTGAYYYQCSINS